MEEVLLGDADEMFMRFFDRWYTEETRSLKGFPASRPDMQEFATAKGRSVNDICRVTGAVADRAIGQIDRIVQAAADDWQSYLPIELPIQLSWIDAIDEFYDASRVEILANRSDPADFANEYLVTVCECGAIIGTVMAQVQPRLAWLASWPYWESSMVDVQTGSVMPVFHWAIKKFSTYGVDDGLRAKLLKCIEILE